MLRSCFWFAVSLEPALTRFAQFLVQLVEQLVEFLFRAGLLLLELLTMP